MEEKINGEDLPALEVQAELKRLLQSPVFAQSDRLGRFLRFAVENALAGTTYALKEYVIGAEVYDRKPPYHPSQDSIVRTEARRLRTKLKEYYESEGKQNPVFIYFRPGSYVPVFRKNDLLRTPAPTERRGRNGYWQKALESPSPCCPLSISPGGPYLRNVPKASPTR